MSQFEGRQTGEMLPYSQGKVEGRSKSFALVMPSTDWTGPIHIKEGNLLYIAYRFKCWSHTGTPSQIHWMFEQMSRHFHGAADTKLTTTIIIYQEYCRISKLHNDMAAKGPETLSYLHLIGFFFSNVNVGK